MQIPDTGKNKKKWFFLEFQLFLNEMMIFGNVRLVKQPT